MKNLLFTGLFCIATIGWLAAQNINLGLKAGLNITDFHVANESNTDLQSRLSFHVGLVSEFMLSERFSIAPELLYSDQGPKSDDTNIDATSSFQYLNVPVMLKYYVYDNLSIEAGPQVGFLLSAKTEINGTDIDQKEDTKNIDFGLNLGLGYKLQNGIYFGARYNLGLTPVDKDTSDNVDVFNRVVQLSIGYYFN